MLDNSGLSLNWLVNLSHQGTILTPTLKACVFLMPFLKDFFFFFFINLIRLLSWTWWVMKHTVLYGYDFLMNAGVSWYWMKRLTWKELGLQPVLYVLDIIHSLFIYMFISLKKKLSVLCNKFISDSFLSIINDILNLHKNKYICIS